jgi:DNA polymerase-3 subunit alpha
MACAVKDAKSKLSGQFSMFGDIMSVDESIKIDYPNLAEIDHREKLKKEKEVCGIYISGNPLDEYLPKMINYNFNSTMIQDGDDDGAQTDEMTENNFVSDIKDGMQIECGGVISMVKKIMTKQGNKPMAIITVEDIYGEFDCMMFNKTYEKFAESLTEDRIVHITGRVSIRVGDKPIILVENLEYLDEKKAEEIQKPQEKAVFGETKQVETVKKVYLKFDITDAHLVETLGEILSCYQGASPVFVQYNKKLYNLGFSVDPTTSLVAEVSSIIGEANIKII